MKKNWTEHFCADCGEIMVSRQNKDGDKFYGCSAFPDCRYTEDAPGEDEYNPEE